jgi:uncharacterized protein with FMN-binding domain
MSSFFGPGHRSRSPEAAIRRTRVRRAVAMGGMLAAVGGLVSVRATVTPSSGGALGASGLAVPVNGAATSSPTGQTHVRHGNGSASSPSSPRATATQHAPARRQQLLGDPFDVSYGVVQVRVTLDGNQITDVTPVSLPQGGRSGDISGYAVPQLLREALAAQSARIDTVSGASYTSAGYAESLQSALDKRGS